MLSFLETILYFVLSLGVLVTFHEFGHFITARLCGVTVERFSIGFGPILFKYTAKNNCEYAVSAIPLGGYVKMKGEMTPENAGKLEPDEFLAQSPFKRFLIIFAGPFFNIVLAIILFTIVNILGIKTFYPVIGNVKADSIAYNIGLKNLDRIVAVNHESTNSWKEFMYASVEVLGSDEDILLTVKGNNGQEGERELKLNLKDIKLGKNENILRKLGIEQTIFKIYPEINFVIENSPAQKAGLKMGDKILEANGETIENWYQFSSIVASSNYEPIKLIVERNNAKYSLEITPIVSKQGESRPIIGISPKHELLENISFTQSYPPLKALSLGIEDTYRNSKLVLVSLEKFVTQKISVDNISGPIAIAKYAKESAQYGLVQFLTFVALISVNLGVFNLLPVPVLDGGQILFILYEMVTKKAPNQVVQRMLTILGAILLLSLMSFAIFNDLSSL